MKTEDKLLMKLFRAHKHAPNEKDAMTSRCLDRKEVLHATRRVQSTGPAWPVETQDVFF